MRPIDALIDVVNSVMLRTRYRKPGKPGEIIENLPPEYRASLKDLKSSDSVMENYLWFGHVVDNSTMCKYISDLKIDFDKKLSYAKSAVYHMEKTRQHEKQRSV